MVASKSIETPETRPASALGLAHTLRSDLHPLWLAAYSRRPWVSYITGYLFLGSHNVCRSCFAQTPAIRVLQLAIAHAFKRLFSGERVLPAALLVLEL